MMLFLYITLQIIIHFLSVFFQLKYHYLTFDLLEFELH
jgi:hypothetical protein